MSYQIDLSKILTVYSGKTGCMCGCLGKYRVPSANVELAGQVRGYAYEPEDVSDRSVKIIAGKVLNHPNVRFVDNCAYVDENGRTKAVYFVDGYTPVKA